MAATQLSDGNSDGASLGQSATDKVGFHGKTPLAQVACTVSAALTTGGTTPADIALAFVELYTVLKDKGVVG